MTTTDTRRVGPLEEEIIDALYAIGPDGASDGEWDEAEIEDNAVPCPGCGLRNHDTTDAFWVCPDYPQCREGVPW